VSETAKGNGLIPAKEFFEGDLPPVGVYGFDILRVTSTTRKRRDGSTQQVLSVRAEIHTAFKTTNGLTGPLEKSLRVSDSFPLSGRGVAKLKSLYKAITGESVPVVVGEDGEAYIDSKAVGEDLLGGGVFGAYTHWTNEDTKEVFGNWGYSFARKPEDVYLPEELR